MKNKKLMAVAPFLIISGVIGVTYGASKGVLGTKAQLAINGIKNRILPPKTTSTNTGVSTS